MLLRRTVPLAFVAAAFACGEPSVPYNPTANNPRKVDYAAFSPTPSSSAANPPNVPADIPLPNDIALSPQGIASATQQSAAQGALLSQWAAQGGFPNDQEVPITIDFVEYTIDEATGRITRSPAAIDVTTVNANTLVVLALSKTTGAVTKLDYDPPKATDYVPTGDHGTLTIHKSPDPKNGNSRRWPAGSEIVYAVRGGPNGVKTGDPNGLQPQPAMYLLLQGQDLTRRENQGIISCDPPVPCTPDMKAAIAAQLEPIRQGYFSGPIPAIDAVAPFKHNEIATMGAFAVAPSASRTHVETDPSAGRIPLPSDFLMDATGHLSKDAQPAFGPLGPGLATLDGFSTTAMVLAQTSTAIQANTVAGGAFIYELTPAPKRLLEATEALTSGKQPQYAAEPSPIVQGGLSTVIGLQPAVPAQLPNGNVVPIPPLKEATTYVVVITDAVKDINGDKLVRSTLGQILLLDPSISIAVSGHSTVSGVTDAQAVGLDQMRLAINAAAQALQAEKSITRDHIVMAYTFKTQGEMKSIAAQLAAMPYAFTTSDLNPTAAPTVYCQGLAGAALPGCSVSSPSVTTAFTNYGIDSTVVPTTNIGTLTEAGITTYNKLRCKSGDTSCTDTGAFNPNPDPNSAYRETITALIAAPQPNNYGGCNPSTSPNGVCTLPLIVFRHGLQSWRGAMLNVADRFTKAGFVVAAIDANKHGDRAFCRLDAECKSGTCVHDTEFLGEGDATGATPGHCQGGVADFVRDTAGSSARPAASGEFLISGNLFRSRDTFRQDIIDEAQLVRLLSPNPFCDPAATPLAANTCANHLITAATAIQIDPARIYYAGSSMGAINGTVDVAANPRFSRAALNVGGATIVDVFSQSPNLSGQLNTLLAGLGITPGTAAYLQFLNVAKWVLDPAEPENFGQNLLANTLPNFIADQTGKTAQSPKAVLGQMALCDKTVPNAFGANLYTLIGLPFNPGGTNTTTASFTLFFAGATATPTCPANGVDHSFLAEWSVYGNAVNFPNNNITQQAQDDIAGFFASSPTAPPPARPAD